MFTAEAAAAWRDLLASLGPAALHTTRRMPYPDGPTTDPGWNDFGWGGAGRDPASATHYEQDARAAADSENLLLRLLATEVDVLGASPLQAAQRLFGDDRD